MYIESMGQKPRMFLIATAELDHERIDRRLFRRAGFIDPSVRRVVRTSIDFEIRPGPPQPRPEGLRVFGRAGDAEQLRELIGMVAP